MAHCAVEWGLYKETKERYNYVFGSRAQRARMLKTALQRHQLKTQKPNHFPPKVAFSIVRELTPVPRVEH